MSTTTITLQLANNVHAGNITLDGSFENYSGSRFTSSQVDFNVSISNDSIGGFNMDGSSYITLPAGTERARLTLPSVALDWSSSNVDSTFYTAGYGNSHYFFNVSVNWHLIVSDYDGIGGNELANVDYGSTILTYSIRNDTINPPISPGWSSTTATLTPSTSTVIINRAGNNTEHRRLRFFLKADPTVQTGTGSMTGTPL